MVALLNKVCYYNTPFLSSKQQVVGGQAVWGAICKKKMISLILWFFFVIY